jgi:hypothetical protein
MTPKLWPVMGTGLRGRGMATRESAAVSAASREERMADFNRAASLFVNRLSPWGFCHVGQPEQLVCRT